MPDVLNLTDPDWNAGEFEAIPSGKYPATITRFEDVFVKPDSQGTLPPGTAGFKIAVVVNEGHEYAGSWVWTNLWVAPAKIGGKPYKNKKMMDGLLARFFLACGFTQEEITSGEFAIDAENIVGREVCAVVGRKQKYNTKPEDNEWDNEIKGFKPISELAQTASAGLT